MRVAEVDGVPVQGTGFFGVDPGAQTQRDVGADRGSFARFQQRGGLVGHAQLEKAKAATRHLVTDGVLVGDERSKLLPRVLLDTGDSVTGLQ